VRFDHLDRRAHEVVFRVAFLVFVLYEIVAFLWRLIGG